jgi:hypothetical protein
VRTDGFVALHTDILAWIGANAIFGRGPAVITFRHRFPLTWVSKSVSRAPTQGFTAGAVAVGAPMIFVPQIGA